MTAGELWLAPLILLAALAIDLVFAALPPWRAFIDFPRRLLFALCHWFSRKLDRPARGPGALRWRGAIVALLIVTLAVGVGWFGQVVLVPLLDGPAALLLMLLPALRPRHALDILGNGGGEAAGNAWAFLVENTLGGLLWFLLLGLPGLYAVIAVSIAARSFAGGDSGAHGFAFIPSRLADVLALFPSLIAWPLAAAAALFVPGTSPGAAFIAGAAALSGWHKADFRLSEAYLAALGAGVRSSEKNGRARWIIAVLLLFVMAGLAALSLLLHG